jgi:apolipoprotein D and lipocalin family protein
VTATGALQANGSVRVTNRGFDPRIGDCRERIGTATFRGAQEIASLPVRFFGTFGGGYHVIDLAPDYSYAVVSGPTRGYLWILSRTPAIEPALLSRLVGSASANGYPTDRLILVDQSGPEC